MKLPWCTRPRRAHAFVLGLGGLLSVVSEGHAQVWTRGPASLTNEAYVGLAMSADGVKAVGVSAPVGYYRDAIPTPVMLLSTNAGASWASSEIPTNYWSSVASSADGSKLVAAAWADSSGAYGTGPVYLSGDAGITWVLASAPRNSWSCVASSALGERLVAAAQSPWAGLGDGLIYNSADFGKTWAPTTAPRSSWTCMTSSADGTRLAATGDLGIYVSVDSGATWVKSWSPTNDVWSCVACSADGTKLVAGGGGLIYVSTNAGQTWTPTGASATNWTSLASSADGNRLIATGDGLIYVSHDGGATWAPVAPGVGVSCVVVASSAEGDSLVATTCTGTDGNGHGGTGTFQYSSFPATLPPPPLLSIGRSGKGLALSWLVPSSLFVLQQGSVLGSGAWVEVTNEPTLNPSNLHYELSFAASLGNAFYRLKQK